MLWKEVRRDVETSRGAEVGSVDLSRFGRSCFPRRGREKKAPDIVSGRESLRSEEVIPTHRAKIKAGEGKKKEGALPLISHPDSAKIVHFLLWGGTVEV